MVTLRDGQTGVESDGPRGNRWAAEPGRPRRDDDIELSNPNHLSPIAYVRRMDMRLKV